MTGVRFLDNITGPWGPTLNSGQLRDSGTVWKVTADAQYATELSFYRIGTGSAYSVGSLYLWDTSTAAIVSGPHTPVDDGTVGWQRTPIPPYGLTNGTTYLVSADVPDGHYYASISYYAYTPPSPFGVTANARCYSSGGTAGSYPNNKDNAIWGGFDIGINTSTVTGSGDTPTNASVDVMLDSYVGASYGDHPTSVVSLTKAAVDAIGTDVTGIQTDITSQGVSLTAAAGDIAAVKAKITSDGVTLDTKIGPLQTYFGVTSQGVSAGLGIVGQTLSDKIDALPALLAPAAPAVGGTGWSLAATTTFAGPKAWAQAGDLYVINFTSTPARVGLIDVDGVDWLPRLGWWAEWDGTYVGERHFVDFPHAYFYLPGRTLGGLLFWCEPGGVGSIEAWTYTP